MGAKGALTVAVAVTLICLAVRAQSLQLTGTPLANAMNCVQANSTVEKQDACFVRTGLLVDGRTPDQIRAFVAETRAQREREAKQILAAALAEQERERKQREAAEAREREQCIARSSIAESEVALVKAQKIQLGMSETALLCSWGRPQKVNRTVNASGEHKQYVYGSNTYVYVENGKIDSWQD
jgi:hypothetical protein